MLIFHGGTLFDSSGSRPEDLANTMLPFMIVCLFGGLKILVCFIKNATST